MQDCLISTLSLALGTLAVMTGFSSQNISSKWLLLTKQAKIQKETCYENQWKQWIIKKPAALHGESLSEGADEAAFIEVEEHWAQGLPDARAENPIYQLCVKVQWHRIKLPIHFYEEWANIYIYIFFFSGLILTLPCSCRTEINLLWRVKLRESQCLASLSVEAWLNSLSKPINNTSLLGCSECSLYYLQICGHLLLGHLLLQLRLQPNPHHFFTHLLFGTLHEYIWPGWTHAPHPVWHVRCTQA